jgi:hypothetical protein
MLVSVSTDNDENFSLCFHPVIPKEERKKERERKAEKHEHEPLI